VDLDDVRTRMEQIQWVRYAFVQRVFPDGIIIKVVEREPIGLARIQGHIYEFDSDAAILEPDNSSSPNLPILDGLRENNPEANLRKIAMYARVVTDLKAEQLSEVILNDTGEVSVVKEDDRLIVNLG